MDETADETTKKCQPLRSEQDSDDSGDMIITKLHQKKLPSKIDYGTLKFCFICILGVTLGLILERINAQESKSPLVQRKLSYRIYPATKHFEDYKGLLKHVHLVLKRIGYEYKVNDTSFDLLWAHEFPFTPLKAVLEQLKPHQKVNHFPATGHITLKVNFATTESKYIPKAFKLPESKQKFLEYAKEHKNSIFLEKDQHHRGIRIKNISDINVTNTKIFVQEYMQNPFLIDGHKFDIGIYVVLTSVNPLRIYWYKGHVLFRVCPEKYYPFDPNNFDKNVVGDKYLPMWRVPAVASLFTKHKFSMQEAFDVYARSKGKDPSKMWDEAQKAIAEIFLKKEKHIVEALKKYRSQRNFFELMRVDFVVDEDLKVYLLEANMSPNLSAPEKVLNQLLYEQLLYNLFTLVGVKRPTTGYEPDEKDKDAQKMVSSERNIGVWGTECMYSCMDCLGVCALCEPCRSDKMKEDLLEAHGEHIHRGDFRRIFPPAMKPNTTEAEIEFPEMLSLTNKLHYLWYQGKCNIDVTWCH